MKIKGVCINFIYNTITKISKVISLAYLYFICQKSRHINLCFQDFHFFVMNWFSISICINIVRNSIHYKMHRRVTRREYLWGLIYGRGQTIDILYPRIHVCMSKQITLQCVLYEIIMRQKVLKTFLMELFTVFTWEIHGTDSSSRIRFNLSAIFISFFLAVAATVDFMV